MIELTKESSSSSVVYNHPETGYLLPLNSPQIIYTITCQDCLNMTRVAMACYAATHKKTSNDETVARMQKKEKKPQQKAGNKYAEMETSVSLDKYNGKLMNSIWGLYNRNSPHNFKSNNAENATAAKQEMITEINNSSLVHFAIPEFQLSGIVSVETHFEVKKPKTTLEKFESLFSFPIF